jgi:hypothetical protein
VYCLPRIWVEHRPANGMSHAFRRYIGIDYSGAETPKASNKRLRIYEADRLIGPVEIEPPPSPRKYWTRRGIAEWLVDFQRHWPTRSRLSRRRQNLCIQTSGTKGGGTSNRCFVPTCRL